MTIELDQPLEAITETDTGTGVGSGAGSPEPVRELVSTTEPE